MSIQSDMPEIDNPASNNAIRLYGQSDAMDDFPVLKAFQQYIDAEQAKARKRLLSLGIFFGVLTGAIIAVFVVLLVAAGARNQALNDRLVEFAMKDRSQQSAVVVQPPQDNSAILAMTAKLEDLQKKLAESQAKAERDAAIAAERARIAAAEAAKPKGPTPEQQEIDRLKALLDAERQKAEDKTRREAEKARAKEEKERKRQEELEAYRRKHYPELYGLPSKKAKMPRLTLPAANRVQTDILLDDDDDAIDYFGEDDELDVPARQTPPRQAKTATQPKTVKQALPTVQQATPTAQQAKTTAPAAPEPEQPYVIPVEVKGRSSSFRIPL